MKNLNKFSINLRILILVSITAIPALIFIISGIYSRYRFARSTSLKDLNHFAKTFSIEQGHSIEGARQLLVAFSESPEVNSLKGVECNQYLSNLLLRYTRYANFGKADKNGKVVCSSLSVNPNQNVADRPFFVNTIKYNKFTVGEYQIDKITKKSILNFGYPTLNLRGEVVGVVFATLDLSWANHYMDEIAPDKDTILMILDKNGTVLATTPELISWAGEFFAQNKSAVNSLKDEGKIIDTVGADGVKRYYVFHKLDGTDSIDPVYVAVGKSKEAIFGASDRYLVKSILTLLFIIILVIVVSYITGRSLIIKRIQDLQEMDKLKSDFVSIASHQLRTPLSAINWFLEILMDEKPSLGKGQKMIVKNIRESNERMINLVESLLNVSRIESRKIRIEPKIITVNNIIHDVFDQLKKISMSKKQKLIIEKISTNQRISADPKLIFEIINNIVSNAIKYTPIAGVIRISSFYKKDRVYIVVKDNGYGISRKDHGKVFQKFFRGENIVSHNIEGTGLGLYISKSIAEEMNGQLTFTSILNKGTTFYLSFPKYVG